MRDVSLVASRNVKRISDVSKYDRIAGRAVPDSPAARYLTLAAAHPITPNERSCRRERCFAIF